MASLTGEIDLGMNRQVLFIAHLFPPAGGPGVQRSAKFVKYLPQFGWQAVVLTPRYPMWSVRDDTLLKDIPPETTVIRTYTAEPRADSSKLHRLFFAFPNFPPWIPDESMAWLPWAVPAALREIRRRPIKAIYATGGPYTSLIFGALLRSITGLPLIVDFRDEWAFDPGFMQGRGPQRRWWFFMDHFLQDSVVNKADKVLLVSDGAHRAFSTAYGPSDKFVVVRNGYDVDDFDAAVLPDLDCSKFHLAYTGSTADVDSRPETFLQGLRRALDNYPPLGRSVQVHFVGDLDQESKEIIVDLGLQPYIRATGYLSHRESVGYLCQVDVLLMIVRIFPNIVPGKVYEYMAAKKPVLALVCRDGETLELLKESGTTFWTDPEDIGDISRQLIRLEDLWRHDALRVSPNETFIQTHTRKHLTSSLATVLEEIST